MNVENSTSSTNVISFLAEHLDTLPPLMDIGQHAGGEADDDTLLKVSEAFIGNYQKNNIVPGLTDIQNHFFELISAGASPMLRDKVVKKIFEIFGDAVGGKRALGSTWAQIKKQVDADHPKGSDPKVNQTPEKPSAEECKAIRDALWHGIKHIAQNPHLMDSVVEAVQARGVVNEEAIISLIYLAATSRITSTPINPLIKGASSSGKSFTVTKTLDFIGPDNINYLSTSSALALVYDKKPLAHTILVVYEANQLQADENSIFSMLLRTLISEGQIVHMTTVEDRDSPAGRRVEKIVREGPISLIITTTGELHTENETRMLSFYVSENSNQTRAVMHNIAKQAAGVSSSTGDLAEWHNFQKWLSLGPNEAVIPYAEQIVAKIPPTMVRFRRDTTALFTCIKTVAILYQAQRSLDAQGRVVATVADYAVAYPIFLKVFAESSGQGIPDNVRMVVEYVESQMTGQNKGSDTGIFKRTTQNNDGPELEITTQKIGSKTGIGRSGAYRAIQKAIDMELLGNNETRPKKPMRLFIKRKLGEPLTAFLPDPDSLLHLVGDP